MIRLEDIHKSFGTNHVLKGVSLEVAAGEVVCIIGPSGSGKSTLLRTVNHLEVPERGRVYIDGELAYRDEVNGSFQPHPPWKIAQTRAKVGMVFQQFNLFPHLTALENVVEAPVYVKRMPRREAAELGMKLLKQVGLEDKADHYPEELSGGQQQRVAIARALAMEPKAMLFDEATSALDPELVHEVLEVMRQLAHGGMTMMVVTHEMRFAQQVADRIVFMDEGRVVEVGSPEQVFTEPQHPRTQEFLRSVLDR